MSPEAVATGAAERRTDSNVHLSNMDEAEGGETNAQKIENLYRSTCSSWRLATV